MNCDDYQLLHISDPQAVFQEASVIFSDIGLDINSGILPRAFSDVLDMFAGRYPGYQACNTKYHDRGHTLDVFLAAARLLHGMHDPKRGFREDNVTMFMVAALMHDIGYIQEVHDTEGTGAKYTRSHVDRGIRFIDRYLSEKGFTQVQIERTVPMFLCTDLSFEVSNIMFPGQEIRLLSYALGTADVVGQMADRVYLEKLSALYEELDEAGIPDFTSEFDLLKKSIGFYKFMRYRLENHLGNVTSHMRAHFRKRWGLDRDLYAEYTSKNMEFLEKVLQEYGRGFKNGLRRQLMRTRH